MNRFLGYRCSLCQTEYPSSEEMYVCPRDGGNLDIILDYQQIKRQLDPKKITNQAESSLWRYLPLLPVTDPGGKGTPLHHAGWTPLYSPQNLARKVGLEYLWIKDEGRNPTASFKDRASAVVVARAQEIQAEIIVTASTGNAGAALAGMSAAIGQKAVIFAPRSAPQAKIAQLLIYGSQVILVDGNYDQAFDLAIEATQEFGWYCRNTGYNPFTMEGKKTAAFEIWEVLLQTRSQKPGSTKPLSIFIPVGDGNIISGIHKGFKDLEQIGWLESMPRLFGVQAEGSASIYNGFQSGTENILPVDAQTIADSISVDLPRDGVRAIRAARETNGNYLTVTDDEILQSIALLGSAGIFSEPAGATAFAGLEKALKSGILEASDPVLVLNTGNGLKDIKAAMQAVQAAPVIEPSLSALKKYLDTK
jgi:threonine synthase